MGKSLMSCFFLRHSVYTGLHIIMLYTGLEFLSDDTSSSRCPSPLSSGQGQSGCDLARSSQRACPKGYTRDRQTGHCLGTCLRVTWPSYPVTSHHSTWPTHDIAYIGTRVCAGVGILKKINWGGWGDEVFAPLPPAKGLGSACRLPSGSGVLSTSSRLVFQTLVWTTLSACDLTWLER